MIAAINRFGLGKYACACVICPLAFAVAIALLPQRTFADAAPEPSSGVSISTQAMSAASPVAIQSAGMIGTIFIFNESIFDLDDSEENKALYKLANKIHITTRPNVIQQQLLFHPGDEF